MGAFQILDSTDDPRFIDTKNRPSLAQTFQDTATGARFTVVVNHLKSKGSDCLDVGDPDLGDGQGNCSVTRTLAAQALVDWLATDPTGSGDPDFLIMGDLNSYAQEDPIDAVKAGPDDRRRHRRRFHQPDLPVPGPYAYSYTFDGQAGYLDHALASASLVDQVTGAADWHINSDEPDVLDYDTSFKPPAQDALYEPNGIPLVRSRSGGGRAEPGQLSTRAGRDHLSRPAWRRLGQPSAPAFPSLTRISLIRTPPSGTGAMAIHPLELLAEANGAGTVGGSHTYTTPGIYTVSVTVKDAYGNSDSAVYEFVVVYDPNGGFVTGGGWINSPAGAYKADPALTGKATFGFVAKYHKGASVPVGNTEFQFKAGDLTFKSTSYQWLVVAGSKAQFKGVGTINGEGVYKFIITAIDGSPDTFRIKIWYEDAAGEHVVYDNGANQALGSGSIIIHK